MNEKNYYNLELDDLVDELYRRDQERQEMFEKLEEIQAICIGADSPDAIDHGERDPFEELQCCREDLAAISNIVEEAQKLIKDIK